jgi:hypothetical protein
MTKPAIRQADTARSQSRGWLIPLHPPVDIRVALVAVTMASQPKMRWPLLTSFPLFETLDAP